ncbi:MAG: hypothetical protein K1X55_09130 [Chitinophagales bacterium]|nr:hypothetical protein [Chitinophagales bacterium]
MWFENLVGFRETNPEQVRDNFIIENEVLISKINQKRYQFGRLEIPMLSTLREKVSIEKYKDKIAISEVVGNVQTLHKDRKNYGAVFQAASQFNLLEMVSPYVTPESGITNYQFDLTQGPACAIACGAGTIYRNYFVPLGNQIGQTRNIQVDCLEEIGKALQNEELILWQMKNGYALANQNGLEHITNYLNNISVDEYNTLKGLLKIGIQWDAEVTIAEEKQIVTQVYCSALPVRYTMIDPSYWESFARLILEATYEATFCAALLNYEHTGNNQLFLTLVGGGAFGNNMQWILDAIEYAVIKFKNIPLNVKMVSYGQSNPQVKDFIERLN